MSSPPPDPEPTSPAADTAYYRGVLHRIIDCGVTLLQVLEEQATHPVCPEPMVDAAAGFERIARTIRRTIALARTLDQPVVVRAASPHRAARTRIRREVEDAIGQDLDGAEAAESREDLRERMDRPEFENELADRPIEEIIAELCRDLAVGAAGGVQRRRPEAPGDKGAGRADPAGPHGFGQTRPWTDRDRPFREAGDDPDGDDHAPSRLGERLWQR
jgi:hypothetical protein